MNKVLIIVNVTKYYSSLDKVFPVKIFIKINYKNRKTQSLKLKMFYKFLQSHIPRINLHIYLILLK